MVPGLVFLAVLVVFAFIVVAKSVALIPQAEAAVIERLGRYSRTVSGQLTLLVPFIDRIRARVDLRERVVSFPPQPVITSFPVPAVIKSFPSPVEIVSFPAKLWTVTGA